MDAHVSLCVDCGDGVRLAVHSYGGRGPPLLILHANGMGARTYEPMVEHLRDSFQVYAADLRGHGASAPLPPGASLDWEFIAKDVLTALDQLSLRGCFVVGHSLGGGTALRAEEMLPGAFSGMFLFEPIAPPLADIGWDRGTSVLAAGARKRRRRFESFDAAIRTYASKPPLSVLDPRCLEAYVRHNFRATPEGDIELCCSPEVEATIFENSARSLASAHLERVACPVVVAAGALDAAEGPALIAPWIAKTLPKGRFEMYPELGHFGPLQRPEAAAAAVKKALLVVGGAPQQQLTSRL